MSEKYILNSDCKQIINIPNKTTLPEYILSRLEEHVQNGRTSCIMNPITEENYTFKDVIKLSRNVASSLYNLGFQKGDTLIYCSHDGANLHIFFLGVWRANGILRSSYPEDMEDQLIERILESKARWILCDKVQSLQCLNACKIAPWVVYVIVFGNVDGCICATDLYQNDKNECPILKVTYIDNAIILPTSGTSGKSKGAIFTHETIVRLLILLESIPFIDDPTKPILLLGKQTHFSGSLLALSCITSGKFLLMVTTINLNNITSAIIKHKPRGLFLFPKFLLEIVDNVKFQTNNTTEFDSIQYISTGGVVVGPSFITTAQKLPNFRSLIILYGMTECGLLSTNINWRRDTNERLMGNIINNFPQFSCGKLPPGTSLIVRDIQTGISIGPNIKGELYFKSKLLCQGYLNNTKESYETIQNEWIRTGDMGYYDTNGFIYVVDRVKETFKYFNNHICPSELENIINGHYSVAEVCVVGIKDPNGGDTIPRAYVVLKKTYINVNPIDIINYTNNLLASYKHLRGGLFILEKLPQGKTGKISRRILLDEYNHHHP